MLNSEHSVLPPSSAARRVACPGSRKLEALYPSTERSEAELEGEAAHLVAKIALEIMDVPTDIPGVVITQDMADGAKLYMDHVYGIACETHLNIEERIDIPRIHPLAWGTPDCWMYSNHELHIWDYKFGFGFVEVFENWQLIAYAAGILDRLKVNGIQDQYITVYMHIVQPRSFHRDGPIISIRYRALKKKA